jgi:N-acetylmuramoyl-L-alanine amidase
MTIKEVKPTEVDTTPEESPKIDISEGYTIQLMASAEPLEANSKRFGELSSGVVEFLGKGAYKYKYCYGKFATHAEAKAELERVHQSFGDAYIVQFKGESLK